MPEVQVIVAELAPSQVGVPAEVQAPVMADPLGQVSMSPQLAALITVSVAYGSPAKYEHSISVNPPRQSVVAVAPPHALVTAPTASPVADGHAALAPAAPHRSSVLAAAVALEEQRAQFGILTSQLTGTSAVALVTNWLNNRVPATFPEPIAKVFGAPHLLAI